MTFAQFNRIVEIRTKVISMGTFLCGSLYAVVRQGTWSWSRFAIMGISVLFIDMGTTGFNSYFDYVRGTDKAERNFEQDKVLVHEGVQSNSALILSILLFTLAGALGIVLAWQTSWYLLVAGGISMAVGYAYTGTSHPISRTPFGELFAGGFLGTVLFLLSYYVQAESINVVTVIASVPFFLLIAMILTVNNTCDRESDRIAGRKTLAVLVDTRTIVRIMQGQFIGAYIVAIILSLRNVYPPITLFFLATTFLISNTKFRNLQDRGFSLQSKSQSMKAVSRIFLLFCLAFVLGMLLRLAGIA